MHLGLIGRHSDHESEAIQQEAFAAARDPNNPLTVEAAERTAFGVAKAAGAQAFEFDPNASTAEKTQQVKARIPVELQNLNIHTTAALASDQDEGKTAGYDLPSPTKEGALPRTLSVKKDGTSEPISSIGNVEEWHKTGWAPRFGLPGTGEADTTLLDHQTLLEGKLDEKFFGDWYHNTGIIIFACILSWVIAVLGGGLGWVFLVMAICGTYYRTSIRRVRRNFRDDIHRELAKARLETDTESLEWINTFMVKFWPIYAPVLCATIINSVDQVLSTSTPAFLDSMRMKFFTLGTKPPRLEHVKTYPKAEDDIVLMDWKFSFTPNDVADLTSRQIKNKINPKIVLEVRVGKAMVSKGFDIIVEDMAFSGLMRVKLKLQIPFPHIEKVEICFLGRPEVDYVCKPLGGDTFGLDINFIPGLETFIMEMIHANLGPIMYDPNVFPIEIAKMLSGNPVDQAIGVLQITFHGAQGLKNPDKFSSTPDPYAVVSINNREALGKTKTVHENANPRWNETVNVILTSLKDNLNITVYDYNEYRKDKELGMVTFALSNLSKDESFENQHLEVIASGRPRGIVQADIRFFPVLEGAKLADGSDAPPPESNTGIVKFTCESAKDLDGSKSMLGQLSPYAVLLLNGKEVQVSQKLKRTNNPIFPDATKELLITDRNKAKLGLVIKDDRGLSGDPIIGTYQIKLDDMMDLMAKGQEWYNLAGVKAGGRTKMTLQWKPVALSGPLGGSGGYVNPIGVLRLHLRSATDLRNLETMGKSDPYARVMVSGIMKARTVTFKSNLNPEWDELIYIPVHSTRERLSIEIMDEEKLGKDRLLGYIEIAAADYVELDRSTGEYEVHDTKRRLSTPLSQGPRLPPRGHIQYDVSFFPTVHVVDPDAETVANGEGDARSIVGSPRTSVERLRARSATINTIGSLKSKASSTTMNGESDLKKQLNEGEKQQTEMSELEEIKEVEKMHLTSEDLTNHESGLLVFKLMDGDLAYTGCHLEIIMDDNLFPAYTSAKTRTKQCIFGESGDAMVRELDVSRITLRLVEEVDKKGDYESESHIRAKLTGETLAILRQALYTPTQLTLKDKEGRESKITVTLRYIPVRMQLDPSESVNNQGNLRVDLLDATDLPAADRNGFSDPFCRFMLGGKEVFKSKVQKKSLQPAWNEYFETQVRSRIAADFELKVFDWDLGGSDDFLGKARIDLSNLEPFKRHEIRLPLDGKSGVVRLAILFKPDYVTKSRLGTSTFSGSFGVPGKVVGAPVKGVTKGVTFVGSGVAKGASLLGRTFRSKKDKSSDSPDLDGEYVSNPTSPDLSDTPVRSIESTPYLSQSPSRNGSVVPTVEITDDPSSLHQRISSISPTGELGTASISIISASNFPLNNKLQCAIYLLPTVSSSNLDVSTTLTEKDQLLFKTKPIKNKSGTVTWSDSSPSTSPLPDSNPDNTPSTLNELHVKKIPNIQLDARYRLVVSEHSTFSHDHVLGEIVFQIEQSGGREKEWTLFMSLNNNDNSENESNGEVVIRTNFDYTANNNNNNIYGNSIKEVGSDATSWKSGRTGTARTGSIGGLGTSPGRERDGTSPSLLGSEKEKKSVRKSLFGRNHR